MSPATDEPTPNWPPPSPQLWLVHGLMLAPTATMDTEGSGRALMLRIGARLNDPSETYLDTTVVLDLDSTVELLAGLMVCGPMAYGREQMNHAMAQALNVSEDEQRRARDAIAHAWDSDRKRNDPDFPDEVGGER